MKNEIYGVVYQTTNTANNMKYIGSTTNLKNLGVYYFGSYFHHNGGVKFFGGRKNLKVKVLKECYSKEQLEKYEEHFISIADASNREDFYNKSHHGRGGFSFGHSNNKWLGKKHKETETQCMQCGNLFMGKKKALFCGQKCSDKNRYLRNRNTKYFSRDSGKTATNTFMN
ncbi:MAG: GIY-YIG nuclease family protein [Firmicutes bacterium]|nr:GIY-YIG nuclease family protein [Bacillota bacterium]